jgi:cysteine synthase B
MSSGGSATGGTIMGTGRALKKFNPAVQVIGVEPDDAFHGLEGLKHMESSLVPAIYDKTAHDELHRVSTEDGWDMSDRLAREEGLHVGHSSGANLFAAMKIAEKLQADGKPGCVVAIVADRGDRYFSPLKWEKRHVW